MEHYMTTEIIWSAVLSGILGLVTLVLRNHIDEVKRLQILLNKTREEMAKEYVTKTEVHADINRVIARLDLLEKKIDRLIERSPK
jgi:hypothetical protein